MLCKTNFTEYISQSIAYKTIEFLFTYFAVLKKSRKVGKRVLEATVEVFCKIDPPLVSDKS